MGYTALHMAAKEGNEEDCKNLLEFGANPNTYGVKIDCNKTPLHRARTQKVVHQLLKHGADPNAKMADSNQNKLGKLHFLRFFFIYINFSV